MKWLDADASSRAVGLEELPGKSNYFIGSDPSQWRANIPNYSKVKFSGVYPGVDLIYYGNQRQLEYDFVVAPGADPHVIRMGIAGAQRVEIDPEGDLVLQTPTGEIRQHKPNVYQEVAGLREAVDGHYVLKGHEEVGFEVSAYDPRRPLIIDPVLLYSTYLGGSGYDTAYAIAADSAGNAYVTGKTGSVNPTQFPTKTPYAMFGGGTFDVFVTKLNANGSALVYSTYLGGNGNETGYGIAVDSKNYAYVTGETSSSNFPPLFSFQGFGGGFTDAFVTKLDVSGSGLIYSTYLGGEGEDFGRGIAVDSGDSAYVTGVTNSTLFPTYSHFPLQPVQGTFAGGNYDAFVTKLNSSGSGLSYSTYLGGNDKDDGYAIAVDSAGFAYVTGVTYSSNFPKKDPFQAAYEGSGDAFVTKVNNTGDFLIYSSPLGSFSTDIGYGIAVDALNAAYVTGVTYSFNFPTTLSPYQSILAGPTDAFVTKVDASGKILVYSTFLGTKYDDTGYAIAIDSAGNAYVTGSTNTPITGAPIDLEFPFLDAFVYVLNAPGSALLFHAGLGGSNESDAGFGIAVDSKANFYVTGYTAATNFPILSDLQPASGGVDDAFVAKWGPVVAAAMMMGVSPTSLSFNGTQGGANPADQTVNITNTGGGTLNWTATASTTSGGDWLRVSPSSGTDTATLTVSANMTGLAAATYHGSIQLAATDLTIPPLIIDVTLTVLPAPSVLPPNPAQTGGFWKFDEGNFLLGCPGFPPYDPQGHVLDWSGLGNHGCIENPRRNVKYTTDAYPLPGAGHFALHLNDPLDAATKDLVGNVFIPHDASLEPPTGMITAQVKISAYPRTGTIVFAKSTFQFVRREPVMPIVDIGGQRRIIGRTVYQLEILSNGRLRATVANDDPLAPGPWTAAESGAALGLGGDWNHIEMKWDGCRLSVGLNGVSLPGVPYDPVPVLGLSYQGTGVDPTFGLLSTPAAISTDESPLVGKIDDVRLSRIQPCTQFSIASTQQLISNVQALNLPAGRKRSLVSMLERVVAKLGPDPTPLGPDPTPLQVAAVNQLGAFINAVEAQRGKTIAQADADALIAVAESLVAGLTMR